jgi:4-hydroxy-L-threonine phosphate dehydrogenase PdxA
MEPSGLALYPHHKTLGTSNVTMPRVAVSMGCSSGVGPELVARLAYHHTQIVAEPGYTLRVYGDLTACDAMLAVLGYPPLKELVRTAEGTLEVFNTALPGDSVGGTSFRAVERAVADIASGECHGLVTGPVSKRSWREAGVPYSGHTEALEALANQFWPTSPTPYQADMLFRFQAFILLLLTRHVPLNKVSSTLNVKTALASLGNLMQYLGVQEASQAAVDARHAEASRPRRIALLGVNPHAHEIGGEEERNILEPLRSGVHQRWPNVQLTSPLPADAFFRGFDATYAKGFDAIVSPYHDQGLIPMKLLGGYGAVNITIGLPFLRTSVSHGTAEDISGQGIANPQGLLNALNYLVESLAGA